MRSDYLLAAVPFFLGSMGVEAGWAIRGGRAAYRLRDTFSNLCCGLGSQVTGLLAAALTYPIYTWVLHHLAFADLSERPALAWAVGALGVDFCYYWYHRASHRIGFFWATHVVHHQSEAYNLSVALRQSWFSSFSSWIFYLPLAWLGVPYTVFVANAALSLLYQFWIHTEAIDRLGVWEGVLNTPSHHRVHHGRNPRYLDKNYGASLIVWDRLFGTFEPENETPVYGVVHPLETWNAVSANVEPWAALWTQARNLPKWRDRFRLWWREPGWPNTAPNELSSFSPKTSPVLPANRRVYAYILFLTAIAGGLALLWFRQSWPDMEWGMAVSVLFATFFALGALLDDSPRFGAIEIGRLLAMPAVGFILIERGQVPLGMVLFFYSLVSWSFFSLFSAWGSMKRVFREARR